MSMCTGCKNAADEGNPRHPCTDPHTCTCQHNRLEPAPEKEVTP